MNNTILLIISLSLSASIMAFFLFAIKPIIRHRISKMIQYYMWLAVILLLIIPFSWDGSMMNRLFHQNQNTAKINIQNVFETPAEENTANPNAFPAVQETPTPVGNTLSTNTPAGNNIIDAPAGNILQLAFYIWLFGLIITLTVKLTGYIRFLKLLKQANIPAAPEEEKILTTLVNGNVKLVRNRYATTPMLIGLLNPCIIIPDNNYSEQRLKYILLHEVTHLKRFDVGVKWLTMLAASIHWFNPLMHFINKEIDHACELACDEAVIGNFSAKEKQAYGDTLLSIVTDSKYPPGVLQVTMSEEKKTLKERLVSIMKYNKKPKAVILISVLLLMAVMGAAFMLGCYSGKDDRETACSEAASAKVEALLSQIMSSPKEFSNPQDYIEAHQEEYNAIIKMDTKALPYLFSEFEKGGQTGLKGHIMKNLCREILGDEYIDYSSTDTQGWYDVYKSYMLKISEYNTPDFVQKNHPKGSILLNNVDLNKEAVKNLVENFGVILHKVSLQAPDNVAAKNIEENYSAFVSPKLMEKWLDDPRRAPGRMLSSPWPDRIDILSIEKLSNSSYEVKGNIIEVTSVEKASGGVAAQRPITLKVNKLDEHWLIDDIIMGEYESGSEQLLGYIKDYNEKTRMLTSDEIEWVLQEDTERVNELGLNANLDFPNGYYIYNESEQTKSFKLANDVEIYIINDEATGTLTDINGFMKRLAEYRAPFHLKVKNGVIVKIVEQYIP